MRRHLFNLLTLLSLLLCVAAAGLWVRSYGRVARIEFGYRGVRWHIRSQAGRVWLDNAPQRRLEEARQKEEYDRLLAEVDAELRSVAVPPVRYGPPDPRPRDPRDERDARVEMMRRLTAKGTKAMTASAASTSDT